MARDSGMSRIQILSKVPPHWKEEILKISTRSHQTNLGRNSYEEGEDEGAIKVGEQRDVSNVQKQ